jgi:hypothetical protein
VGAFFLVAFPFATEKVSDANPPLATPKKNSYEIHVFKGFDGSQE